MEYPFPNFYSPYSIFIKDYGTFSDLEVLAQLGIQAYRTTYKETPDDELMIFVGNDDDWIHIMDNDFYTLWYFEQVKTNIKKLGQEYEIYHCSVGDTDESFDFSYYKDGILQRHYEVDAPKYNGGYVSKNIGNPLPKEEEALKLKDQLDIVMAIAKNLGVDTDFHTPNIRCYQITNYPKSRFRFNENEY